MSSGYWVGVLFSGVFPAVFPGIFLHRLLQIPSLHTVALILKSFIPLGWLIVAICHAITTFYQPSLFSNRLSPITFSQQLFLSITLSCNFCIIHLSLNQSHSLAARFFYTSHCQSFYKSTWSQINYYVNLFFLTRSLGQPEDTRPLWSSESQTFCLVFFQEPTMGYISIVCYLAVAQIGAFLNCLRFCLNNYPLFVCIAYKLDYCARLLLVTWALLHWGLLWKLCSDILITMVVFFFFSIVIFHPFSYVLFCHNLQFWAFWGTFP